MPCKSHLPDAYDEFPLYHHDLHGHVRPVIIYTVFSEILLNIGSFLGTSPKMKRLDFSPALGEGHKFRDSAQHSAELPLAHAVTPARVSDLSGTFVVTPLALSLIHI